MKAAVKKAAGIAGSAIMLVGVGSAYAAPQAAEVPMDATPLEEAASTAGSDMCVSQDKVAGIFSFTQGEVNSNDTIAATLGQASTYLCGSQYMEAGDAIENILVTGDVNNEYVATWEDFSNDDTLTTIMGCSCAANPTDGRVSVNAEVTGIPLALLLERAEPVKGANTVVFTSQDGYEIALPLFYLMQHNGIIVNAINGASLDESIGGTNQLWVGSTAASYFARDIVAISVEVRQTPPPAPGTKEAGDMYANTPNVALMSSELVKAIESGETI